jgi:hypothetical protein
MGYRRRTTAAGLAVAAASALGLSSPSAASAADWTIEPVRFPPVAFSAVAGSSPTHMFAVGWERAPTTGRDSIEIRRRDAAGEWRVELISGYGRFNGVATLNLQEAWAVGSSQLGSAESPLAYHFARGHWEQVRTPPLVSGGRLNAVATVATNDVWAVGSQQGRFAPFPLIEHWNGTAWSVITGPGPRVNGVLYGVAARAANDVWAVGARASAPAQPLIEHWDGHRWSIVDAPALPGADSSLRAVAAVSARDVWAVGGSGLIQRYDGRNWKIVHRAALPEPVAGLVLTGVAARNALDVWAVGHTVDTRARAVTLHWDGLTWTSVPAPNPGTVSNELYGVATPADGSTTVVGLQVNGTEASALTARR